MHAKFEHGNTFDNFESHLVLLYGLWWNHVSYKIVDAYCKHWPQILHKCFLIFPFLFILFVKHYRTNGCIQKLSSVQTNHIISSYQIQYQKGNCILHGDTSVMSEVPQHFSSCILLTITWALKAKNINIINKMVILYRSNRILCWNSRNEWGT